MVVLTASRIACKGGILIQKKSKLIAAYILCLVVVGACIYFLVQRLPNSNSNDEAAQTESWSENTPEGEVEGIVTHEYTDETLPPDVEAIFGITGELDTSTDMAESVDTSKADVTSEPMQASASDEPEFLWLETNNRRLSTAVRWGSLNPIRNSNGSISYSVSGSDVTISLVPGDSESYKELVLGKASSLGAEIKDELITYSPTRMEDVYMFDKYTLSYFRDEEQTDPAYVYYLISEADDDLVYLVTISTDTPIDDDSDIFGILEYDITTID